MAWRQTHDSPNHGQAVDGPFSFCSFPFLLNPRAKSKLLHAEARNTMTQVCDWLCRPRFTSVAMQPDDAGDCLPRNA